MPDVTVHRVLLPGSSVPRLDGAAVMTGAGVTVRFEPPKSGTLVLDVGMGSGKTWRTIEWLSERKDNPLVVVTARKNLACKFEADLRRVGIDVHNYLTASKQQKTVRSWCRHRAVIISGEQVHTLVDWLGMYQGCTLVIDEFGTLAGSFGGETIREPETTMTTLADLTRTASYTILMDADADIDGKCEAFIRGIAPMNDVLYVQSTAPAMKRTLIYGFKSNTEHVRIFNEFFEHSLYRSRAARRAGTPNRTFFGGTTRKQVIERSGQATKLGMPNGCYHGYSNERTRRRDFADADQYMEELDLLSMSTVGAIGTDIALKCSWGFFETAKGDAVRGVSLLRMLAQLMGRPGRSSKAPLDGVVLGEASFLDESEWTGALFVLIDDTLPSAAASFEDRVELKFRSVNHSEREKRNGMRRADEAVVAAYRARHSLRVDNGDGTPRELQQGTVTPLPSIEKALTDIKTWNEVERRDNYECHTIKLFELCLLPTRGFDLVPIEPLNAEQRQELDEFRRLESESPAEPWQVSDDRRVADMTDAVERYEFVRESVLDRTHKMRLLDDAITEAERRAGETGGKGDAELWCLRDQKDAQSCEDAFWYDCDGLVPRDGTAQRVPTGIDGAFHEVWCVLKDVREFPPSSVYSDLHADRQTGCNVLGRALMRFVPEQDIQVAQVRARETGHAGAPGTYQSMPASHKLPLLREFARAVGLRVDDLLEPRTFTAEEHAWVAAYNRLQTGGRQGDMAMADNARSKAIGLGCRGIKRGQRATGLRKTIQAVLEQQCAMKPATTKKGGLVTINPGSAGDDRPERLVTWRVEERAPGYAEKMLVYHPVMYQHVAAAEYRSSFDAWRVACAEEVRERNGMLMDASADIVMGDVEIEEVAQGPVDTRDPFVPNVRYMHFEAKKIEECIKDWRSDEMQRRLAESALLMAIVRAEAARNDGMLRRLRAWRSALKKLSARHAMLERLDQTLPPPDEEGRRTQREEYEYKARSLDRGRYYAKGRWDDYGDGKLRTLCFPGLPSDLRVKLCGRYYFDADGFCSDIKLYIHEAKAAGLDADTTKHCRKYSESKESRGAWHARVAKWYADKLDRCVEPSSVKRWPNILGNTGGHGKCLEEAGLPENCRICPDVRALQDELLALRTLLLAAECNREYAERQRAHLRGELVYDVGNWREINKREIENKTFSYLIHATEDRTVQTSYKTFRRMAREAVGASVFDNLPAKYRDTGAFVYDGQAVEVRDGFDVEAALRQAEADLKAEGIEYVLEEKPFHGRQDEPMESVEKARKALAEAMAEVKEVRETVKGNAKEVLAAPA